MSQPWYDLAAGKLDNSDSIQKTYPCSLDKNNGYLCLSNDKLVFVNVKGFLKKSYNVAQEVPYTDLKEVMLGSRYKLNLVHQTGENLIDTGDLSAKTIMRAIQDIVNQSPAKDEVVFLEN